MVSHSYANILIISSTFFLSGLFHTLGVILWRARISNLKKILRIRGVGFRNGAGRGPKLHISNMHQEDMLYAVEGQGYLNTDEALSC